MLAAPMLPWERCVVCMKLSQDAPEQLKPPEKNVGEDKPSQVLVGGHPHGTGPQEMGLT